MSEQPEQAPSETPVPDPEWRTECEFCGTELQTAEVASFPDADSEHRQSASPATVVAQDFCPNPDCPGKGSAGDRPQA